MGNASYQTYKTKVAAMSMRERLMVCSVGIVLFFVPGFMGLIDGNQKSITQSKATISTLNADKSRLIAELQVWSSKLQSNPNEALRKEIEEYTKELAKIDAELSKDTVNLIDASKMTEMLVDVLNVDGTLKIMSVESSEPELALQKEEIKLFRHGVKIAIKGRYLDILRHLKEVEKLPYSFYWKSMSYEVEEYPNAMVILELYTLSINKDFIRG
jgi:MSHA biogenesis protein MshJ